MNIKQWFQAEYLPLSLIALMVLTRFHHFGDVLHLPDASLAVFFFAGFYRKKLFFAFLLVLAAFIDYLAIENGTSGWCVTPAYIFLIPTYAVVWFAGRYCSTFKVTTMAELAKSAGLLTLAISAAFAISNGSFYLFSGRYEDISFGGYVVRVAQYYPFYVGSALIYTVAGVAIFRLFKALTELWAKHKSV